MLSFFGVTIRKAILRSLSSSISISAFSRPLSLQLIKGFDSEPQKTYEDWLEVCIENGTLPTSGWEGGVVQ